MRRTERPYPGPQAAPLGRFALRAARTLQRRARRVELDDWQGAGSVVMGRFSYGTPAVVAYRGDRVDVRVGSFVSIAEGVHLFAGGGHHMSRITTYPPYLLTGSAYEAPQTKGGIAIGHDVWVGRDAAILSGVEVGSGAVIAARATVTRNVRPYALVAGNPAREVRRRFTDDEVDVLLRIRWWDWPLEKIERYAPLLFSDDINAFLNACDRAHESLGEEEP